MTRGSLRACWSHWSCQTKVSLWTLKSPRWWWAKQNKTDCYPYPEGIPHLFASFSWLPSGSSASWDARLSFWAHFTLNKDHINVIVLNWYLAGTLIRTHFLTFWPSIPGNPIVPWNTAHCTVRHQISTPSDFTAERTTPVSPSDPFGQLHLGHPVSPIKKKVTGKMLKHWLTKVFHFNNETNCKGTNNGVREQIYLFSFVSRQSLHQRKYKCSS